MNIEREERLTHEAITGIVRQIRLRARQREDVLYNNDVLDALHEMTGTPREELAELARIEGGARPDHFFSVGRQLLIAGCFLLVFPGLPLMWFWLLR